MSSLRDSYSKIAGVGGSLSNVACSIDGNPTSLSDIVANYSVTPTEFYIQAPAGYCMTILQVNVSIGDSGSIGLEDYGSIVGGLTNGLSFFIDRGEGVVIFPTQPIKTNYDIANLSSVTDIIPLSGSERIITYRELETESTDGLLVCDGDRFGIIANDDFSTLVANRVLFKVAIRKIAAP